MYRHSAVTVACLAAVGLAANLPAQTLEDVRDGARVRVEVPGGEKERILMGVLVTRTADTLQIRLDHSHELVPVPVNQARRIEVSLNQHSGAGRGAGYGFLVGGMVGALIGGSCDCGRPGLALVVIGGMMGGLGTALGALIGSGSRVDEWTPVTQPPSIGARPETQPGGITLLQLHF